MSFRVEHSLMGCIVNAKTSSLVDEFTLLIVDQMASGAQLRSGMCQKSQLAFLLASCSFLFELWLVTCHCLKDLRELLRSAGLQQCFSSSCYAHPPSKDSFITLQAQNSTVHTDKKDKVCMCVFVYVCVLCVVCIVCHAPLSAYANLEIPIETWAFLSISSPLLSTVPLHFHSPFSVSFHSGQATHIGNLRSCLGSVICTDKSA